MGNNITKDFTFSKQFEMVKEFNALSGKSLDKPTAEQIKLQASLVEEEIKELLEAWRSGDVKEIVKEVCDVFVVGSYLNHMCGEGFGKNFYSEVRDVDVVVDKLSRIDINSEDVFNAYYYAIDALNSLNVDAYGALTEVCSNNLSKYPLKSSFNRDIFHVLDEMEKKYEGRYTEIKCETVIDSRNQERLKFTDSNGKVLKPLGYAETDISKFI